MQSRSWNETEIQFLKDNYPQQKASWIAEQLQRSLKSISWKLETLGLVRCSRKPWKADEIEFVRSHYPEHSAQWIGEQLGRPARGVEAQISNLGLQQWREWTPIEDDYLRYYWGNRSPVIMSQDLERSVLSIGKRLSELGLSVSNPKGYESILAATNRSGFSTKKLLKILFLYKVELKHAPTRRNNGHSHRRMRIVKIEDVNQAIKRYMGIV